MIKKGHAYKNAKYTSVPSSSLKHHVNRSEDDADSVYIRSSNMTEPFGLPMMFKMELGKCVTEMQDHFYPPLYTALNKNLCTILTLVKTKYR